MQQGSAKGITSEMQKRFSLSAAHELRTPLTVLKAKLDVFHKKPEHTREEYDRLLTAFSNQTDRLSDLVKDLLELTNMDALECSDCIELHALLEQVTAELSAIAAEKNVTITLNGEEKNIWGNRPLLYRVFYNLVENAIKYNHDQGPVTVCVTEREGHSFVTVSDTGIRIPKELCEMVFEPFFRVDKSRSRRMGGAGLGLATVKAIVEKHHGTISVSTNTAGGSCFTVEL